MAHDVFDEQLSLRRLLVALRRADWRMFAQGLERLSAEIAAGSPFRHHQAWQECLQEARAHADLPEASKEALREAIARLLSLEVRVAPRVAASEEPVSEASTLGPGVAVVAAWRSSLGDPAALAAYRTWLADAPGGSGIRQPLAGWLAEPHANLAALVDRANLTLAAREAGVATSESAWIETFMAGLGPALACGEGPFAGEPADLLAAGQPISLLVAEPTAGWEARHGADEPPFEVLRLAGSLDWFYCHRCHHDERLRGMARALVVACARCGGPAWPLVVPLDSAALMPPPIRNVWARAARRLREAGTWVLVEPPMPDAGAFEAWLLDQLVPGRHVLVVADDDATLKAWQSCLADRGLESLVTSRGPATGVLGFLLRGGATDVATRPEEAATADVGPPAVPAHSVFVGGPGARLDPKKKPRR